MRITKLLLYSTLLLMSCKTHKEAQKESLQVKATAESSKEVIKQAIANMQSDNTRLDSATNKEQSDYERETFITQTSVLDSNGKNISNTTNTYIKEKGKKTRKEKKTSQQTTKETTAVKQNETSGEKKSAATNKVAAAKHTVTRRTGSSLWLIVLLLIVVAAIVLWKWKGKQIVALIKAVRNVLKNGMPNTPA